MLILKELIGLMKITIKLSNIAIEIYYNCVGKLLNLIYFSKKEKSFEYRTFINIFKK